MATPFTAAGEHALAGLFQDRDTAERRPPDMWVTWNVRAGRAAGETA